ncbi:MAG: hypothetical protein KIS92_00435 [Planctomycetota bacterium]|nr:hypothetical protein [Planctomycetota bacterium]
MSDEVPSRRARPHGVSLALAAGVLAVLASVSFWADGGEGGGFLCLMLALSVLSAVVTAVASELWMSLRQAGREARTLAEQFRDRSGS